MGISDLEWVFSEIVINVVYLRYNWKGFLHKF